jgi:septum site-determining protein MinD
MVHLHKIAVVSGKGGVGKTTTTLNLGLALYKLGVNVVLIDGNITTPNLGLYLGMLKTAKTLNDVLKGKAHISESIHQHKSGLKFIPSDLSVDGIKDLNFNKLRESIVNIDDYANLVLVDTAATLGSETQKVLEVVDEALIVTNTDKGAMADALKTIGTCKRLKTHVIGIIINKAKGKLNKPKIEKFLGLPIIGVIKHDNKFVKSTTKGKIYLETYKTDNVNRYYTIAEKFLGKSYVKKLKKQKGSLYNYMLRQLGILPKRGV